MKYITASKLKEWRNKNKGKKCPIYEINLNDVVVDHNHNTGIIRGCIHRQANAWEGKVYNAWMRYGGNNSAVSYSKALENLSKYVDKTTEYYHPVGVTQLCKRFQRLSKDEQVFALNALCYTKKEINACRNSKERVKLYRLFLTKNKYE